MVAESEGGKGEPAKDGPLHKAQKEDQTPLWRTMLEQIQAYHATSFSEKGRVGRFSVERSRHGDKNWMADSCLLLKLSPIASGYKGSQAQDQAWHIQCTSQHATGHFKGTKKIGSRELTLDRLHMPFAVQHNKASPTTSTA